MSQFSYPHEFYNSCENQYNPYNFTPNTYGYFNNNYCTSNLDYTPPTFQNFQDNPVCTPPNFQNDDQPSTLETRVESLLEMSIQQNEEINELCNLYMCNNSSESFQNNQNSISPQNSNDSDYNLCQFNLNSKKNFKFKMEM